jgi:hypothetical protein
VDGQRNPTNAASESFVFDFTFDFALTRAEHRRAFDDLHPLHWWHLVAWITAPGGNATRRAAIWLASAFFVVLGFPLLFVKSHPRVGLVGPLLIAIAYTWLMLIRALRRRAAAATWDKSAALQGRQRWRLGEAALEIEYLDADVAATKVTKLAWRDVMRIEETRDGFGFVVSLERTGFLPRRVISDAQLARVRELLARVNPAPTDR